MSPALSMLLEPPVNPLLFLAPLSGSLTAYERANPASRRHAAPRALSLTGSGAVRWRKAENARTNYFTNPGLANNATNWSNAGSAVGTRTADSDFRSGFCDEVVATASTSDGLNLPVTIRDVSLSGAALTIGIDTKHVSGATDWEVAVRLTDAAGTLIGSVSSAVNLVPAASVARAVLSITAPTIEGAHGLHVRLRRKTASAGTARFSGVTVEVGATSGSYFDGSTVPDKTAWLDPITGVLGTAHASPSVSQAAAWVEEGTTNTDSDPVFGNASITNFHSAAGSAAIAKVTTFAYLGAAAGECVCAASTSDGIQQKSTTGGAASNGQAWTFSGHIRAKASGDVGLLVTPQILERDASDVLVKTNSGSAITLTDAPQFFSFTVTLSGGGTVAKVTWALKNAQAAICSFNLLDKQLEQKAYATSVAAGSLGTGYAWAGSANASASTRTGASISFATANRMSLSAGHVVARAKHDYNTGATQFVFFHNPDGSSRVYVYRNSSKKPVGGFGSNSAVGTAAANREAGTSYVAATGWTGPSATLVVDQVLEGRATATPPTTQGTAQIGSNNGSSEFLNGPISPVAIFDDELRASELAKVTDLASKGALAWDSLLRAA